MGRIRGPRRAGLAVFAVALSLVGCSSGSPTAASTPSRGAPTTPAAQPSATFVPMQTAHGGEFLSPTGNISCEVNAQADLTAAYCQTHTPPRSVTMDATGRYRTCDGEQCLGDAGESTPTLAYGTATGVGPFRCESATEGVTCVANGRGFRISASGITAVPS